MDRVARPKDDLFDNSVMTFGEHLEELRGALVRAIYWLIGGLLIGLLFANSLILFIQRPLSKAIQNYQASRSLSKMGFDPTDQANLAIMEFLMSRSLEAELVYTIPEGDPALAEISPLDLQLKPAPAADDKAASDADTPVDAPSPRVDETSAKAKDANMKSKAAQESETAETDSGPPLLELSDLIKTVPDVSALQPTLQFRQNEIGLNSLKMEEPFMIWFKAGLILGAVIASPGIFYHLWSFVAAGLHMHERRYVYLYLPISVILFVSGVVLAFFLVLQYVLTFLLGFNSSMEIAVEPRLTYYVNFVLLLPLGFGVAFQLPIVMLFLQRIGLFETRQYIESWKIAILAIFVIAMILTPADVTSMVALAIPLVFLYLVGILMCQFLPRGRGLGSQAYDPV